MDAEDMQRAFDGSFDQAIVFHAYTDYMRDYAVYTHLVAAPSTGIRPAFVRWLFTACVEAHVTTAVTDETWPRSLDDKLVNNEPGDSVDGFVWGVRWQCLYPGARIVADSASAAAWTERIGVRCHEAVIETNVHTINLVFVDLEVSELHEGHVPFTIASG